MTTLQAQPNTLHASLIEALNAEDPERALEQAFLQLGAGANMPLLLAMVKALVRAGLGGIAVRLLRSASGLLAAEPQLAALAAQLERVPSGEVAAAKLAGQLDQNLAAIREVDSDLFAVLAENEPKRGFHVFLSRKRNVYVLADGIGGKLEFVFPFCDQAFHAAALKTPALSMSSAFVMVGVPLPAMWMRVVGLVVPGGFTPPIDVVETDVDVLRLWLSIVDVAQNVRDGRLMMFAGADATDRYKKFLIEHPTRLPAAECMTNHRPRWQPPIVDRLFIENVNQAQVVRKQQAKSQLDALYADKTAEYWRERFATAGRASPPLRVVGFTTRFSTVIQHSMRDLGAAFKRLGCEFETIKQAGPSAAAVDVVGELTRTQPDMLVVMNHVRAEMVGSIPANVPYVCWIQDHMQQLCDRKMGQSITAMDLVLGHSPDVMASAYGYPLDRFLPTNNLTSTDVFSDVPIDAGQLEKYRCDVSYVAHGWESPEQLVREAGAENPSFVRYLDCIRECAVQRLNAKGWLTTQDLVDVVLEGERNSQHRALSPEVRRSVVLPAAQRIIDRVVRHQTLEWAARWVEKTRRRFRIFGRGWENHPTFRTFAGGEVPHGEALRCVYQASAINLQINAYGSLHQRLLDGLAAGGFVLSRYVPADFIREPFVQIRECIERRKLASIQQIVDCAKTDAALASAIRQTEELTGTRLAPMSDAQRAKHVAAHVQCASLAESDFSDEGLFNLLKNCKGIPHRAASDITNFAKTTFACERELCAMLDRYVHDPAARMAVASPMRQSVIEQDTYDGLAGRVLREFQSRRK